MPQSIRAVITFLATAPIWLVAGADLRAGQVLINFDTGASGQPISAPTDFLETSPLTNLYGYLGVRFLGPTTIDGGAILNQNALFGISALSGSNFLAFNRSSAYEPTDPDDPESPQGVPTDPETIRFFSQATQVSIFAAGGFFAETFTMNAYDASGTMVDSDTVTTQGWSQLSVNSAAGIQSVVLTETTTIPVFGGAFVYDNLAATLVPEPSAVLLLATGLLGVIVLTAFPFLGRRTVTARAKSAPNRSADQPAQ